MQPLDISPKKQHKDSAITLRISKQKKYIISNAARIRDTTVTNFILEEAFQTAQEVLADQVRFNLNDEQWQLFCDALDRPAQSIEKLSNLLNQPSILDFQ